MANPRKKNFSVAESAEYIGRSTKTVRRHIKEGLLEHSMVRGKFGPEIRVTRRSLNLLLKQRTDNSSSGGGPVELLNLFRKASPETRELVLKILKTNPEEEEKSPRVKFGLPLFRKKGGDST